MYVVMAQFDIEPEHSQAFLTQLIAHAQRSLDGERGTEGFEIVRDATDPNRILVREGYRDRSAYETHRQGKSLARFYGTYEPHREADGTIRLREAATGRTAGCAHVGSGMPVFPSEGEG